MLLSMKINELGYRVNSYVDHLRTGIDSATKKTNKIAEEFNNSDEADWDSEYGINLADSLTEEAENTNSVNVLVIGLATVLAYTHVEHILYLIYKYYGLEDNATQAENWERIKEKFKAYGVKLAEINNYEYCNTLRELNNSFKHNNSIAKRDISIPGTKITIKKEEKIDFNSLPFDDLIEGVQDFLRNVLSASELEYIPKSKHPMEYKIADSQLSISVKSIDIIRIYHLLIIDAISKKIRADKREIISRTNLFAHTFERFKNKTIQIPNDTVQLEFYYIATNGKTGPKDIYKL